VFKKSTSITPIQIPGSKSITNRALIIATFAKGNSLIQNALKSDDTRFMAKALKKLGVKITEPTSNSFFVQGTQGKFYQPKTKLFLGNAGTAVRFLTATACLVNGEVILDGDKRMQQRPITDLVNALKQLGIKIQYLKKTGCLPLKIISNGKLTATTIKIQGNISSQFISALLMILPFVKNGEIMTLGKLASKGYIKITQQVMQSFGVRVFSTGRLTKKFKIKKQQNYQATNYLVEPDASSATYFWAAEKLLKQKIKILNAPKIWTQPDAKVQKIIQKFPNLPAKINGENFPDAIPTLAVLAAFTAGKTCFTGIANLRVKECDRISALATELNKIKPDLAEEKGDDLVIHGDSDLAKNGQAAKIETYQDHRIAMSFALVKLKIPKIKICNPKCVEKSFPEFFEVWKKLDSYK
jgi:3-phosphoshikimate 1-carboxyvinyltransferase